MIVLVRYSLIITTLCILLTSCVAPKSVRPTGSYIHSNRKPIKQNSFIENNDKTKKIQTNLNSSLNQNSDIENQTQNNQDAIAGISDEDSTNNLYDENIIKQLPPLQEQLRYISANQIEIQNDLSEVKNAIHDLENRIIKLENNANFKQKNDKKYENLILPDEAVKKSKQELSKKQLSANNTKSNEKPLNNEENNNVQEQINEIKNILNQRDYSKAINELQEIVKKTKDPLTINLCYFYLGESHFGLKQFDKAIDFYKKVIHSGDKKIVDDALVKIAEANVNLGDLNEAKKFFKELITRFPKSENVPYARKMLQKI